MREFTGQILQLLPKRNGGHGWHVLVLDERQTFPRMLLTHWLCVRQPMAIPLLCWW